MKAKYTVVNTYSASTETQREKAKAEASRGVYQELLRYAEGRNEPIIKQKTA